jgi:acetyl-CoA C-acetyltransferase
MVKTWGITRAEQDTLALESHQKCRGRVCSGLLQGSGHDLSGSVPGQQHPHATRVSRSSRSCGHLRLVVRGNVDGGQFDADDGRRVGGAAGHPRRGRGNTTCRCLPFDLWQGRRGRLRREEGRTADGAGLCRAAHACRCRLTLQDFDFYEIHEAFAGQVLCTLKAWTDPGYCREKLALARRAGQHRPQQIERQRRQRRHRPSVRRDGYAPRSRRWPRYSMRTKPSADSSRSAPPAAWV